MADIFQGHGLNFWVYTISTIIVLAGFGIGLLDIKASLKKPEYMNDSEKTQKLWRNYFIGIIIGLIVLIVFWYIWTVIAYPLIPEAWK